MNIPVFEKEILLETVIVKRGKKFPITPQFLENCARQYRRMKESGVKVNVHSGHTHTPETKRGEVLAMYTKKRKDGTLGLFGKISFLPHLSKQTIQTLVSNDVSVELPQTLYDAKGNFYSFPVQRVAITPDPAVTGMSPFVRQKDIQTQPVLTLSIDTLNKEKTTMSDDELLDDSVSEPDAAIPPEEVPEDIDEETDSKIPVSGKKRAAFLDSQLAKILFDALEIDPNDFEEEEELIGELNVRLTGMLTIQNRLLAALNIKQNDKNKFELLSSRVTELTEFMEQFDEDGDGEVDAGDVKESILKDDSGEEDATIDESLDTLEANDKKLELSISALQHKNAELGGVIKGLVAKNRQLELDNMLQSGEINKAVHQKAVKRFVLKLSLNDGFDDFIDGARMNNRSTGHSKTPPQQPAKNIEKTDSWAKIAKKISAPYKRS